MPDFSKMDLNDKLCYGVFIAVVIFIIILVIYFLWSWFGSEHMTPYYLNQMVNESWFPIWQNYFGRSLKDVAGQSSQDYYLENQMNAETGVGPQYFEGNLQFEDHTNYMDMPIRNRPLKTNSASAAQMLSEIHSNNMEENAYVELNQVGHY